MIDVLKQALKALEANDHLINGTGTKGGLVYCMDGYYSDCFDVDPINKQTDEAIAAIKEAMKDAEQSQRTWVGLTNEEIGDEYVRFEVSKGGFNRFEYAVKAIEAKLKEKNT